MPINPYADRKVSLRRPHGDGDLDVVRASYTRRKANVTEALEIKMFWAGPRCTQQRYEPSRDTNLQLQIFKIH